MDRGHHHHQLHPQYPSTTTTADTASAAVGGGDRFPQWSTQETRDFLMIRAELDQNFMETKRNKLLWEVISTRMKEKGYSRSSDQCKCKWKNLVTRYKGCETMETEAIRQQQFPFYDELQTIFSTRMQRMLWLEAEGSGAAATSSKAAAAAAVGKLSSEEEEENEESDGGGGPKKKRKVKVENTNTNTNTKTNRIVVGLRGMMEEWMKQQMQVEKQWKKAYEEMEEERRVKEMEWRQTMEALENERIVMEKRWREKEEQRKTREEARAEKRDALVTALLNKLRREDDNMAEQVVCRPDDIPHS